MASIREGRWDCAHCNTKGIRGPELSCTACGSPRPWNVKFYLPEGAEIIKEEEVIKEAESGANWQCSFCGSHNKANDSQCANCGNNRSDSHDKALKNKEYGMNNIPRDNKPKRSHTPPAPTTSKKSSGGCGILAVLVPIALVLWFLFGRQKSVDMEVVRMQWERTIHTEVFKEVVEENWNVPSGGRTISSSREIHHYDKVQDGYETKTRTKQVKVGEEEYVCGQIDKGNGYFKDKMCTRPVYENRQETYREPRYRKEAVYKTKYKYAIKKWAADKPIMTSGTDKNPQWGQRSDPLVNNSMQREGKREEHYKVVVREDDGTEHEEAIDFTKWKGLSVGDRVEAKKNGLGQYKGIK